MRPTMLVGVAVITNLRCIGTMFTAAWSNQGETGSLVYTVRVA